MAATLCDSYTLWQLHSVIAIQFDSYSVWYVLSSHTAICRQHKNWIREWKLYEVQNYLRLPNTIFRVTCIKTRRIIKPLKLVKQFLAYITRYSELHITYFVSRVSCYCLLWPWIIIYILFCTYQPVSGKVSLSGTAFEKLLWTWKLQLLHCHSFPHTFVDRNTV